MEDFALDFLVDGRMTDEEVNAISVLGCAHIGDAVYELLTRKYLILHGLTTNTKLHSATTAIVCCQAQATAYEKLLPVLNEKELSWLKRGRNTSVNSVPKNATHAQYAKATAVETLFGVLYLKGELERINELYNHILEEKHAL